MVFASLAKNGERLTLYTVDPRRARSIVDASAERPLTVDILLAENARPARAGPAASEHAATKQRSVEQVSHTAYMPYHYQLLGRHCRIAIHVQDQDGHAATLRAGSR